MQLGYLITHIHSPQPQQTVDPQTQQSEFWALVARLSVHAWHRAMSIESATALLRPSLKIKSSKMSIGNFVGFSEADLDTYDPSKISFGPAFDAVSKYCADWATFAKNNRFFVKFLGSTPGYYPSQVFVLLRLLSETVSGVILLQVIQVSP